MTESHWKLEDNCVTISVSIDPQVEFHWDAATVDEHLKQLGEMRAHMKPKIQKNFVSEPTVKAIADPMWAVERDALLGNALLHVRDPRFGWLHYMIPKEEARKLAASIQRQVDAPCPGPKLGKPN